MCVYRKVYGLDVSKTVNRPYPVSLDVCKSERTCLYSDVNMMMDESGFQNAFHSLCRRNISNIASKIFEVDFNKICCLIPT